MKTTCLALLTFFVCLLTPGAASELPRKKFIEVGWDMPDTAFLRQHWQEMERAAPFDGLNFYVAAWKNLSEKLAICAWIAPRVAARAFASTWKATA